MNKRHKSFDFDAKMLKYKEGWHRWEAPLRQLLAEADRRASEHPSSGTHHLLTEVARVCRSLGRDLLTQYGYMVRPVKIELVSMLSDDRNLATEGHIVDPERFPDDPGDLGQMRDSRCPLCTTTARKKGSTTP